MNRVELANICNKIIDIHINDLRSELPDIIEKSTNSSNSIESNTGNIVANVAVNSIRHSVQAVTDVLVNLGLLDLDE